MCACPSSALPYQSTLVWYVNELSPNNNAFIETSVKPTVTSSTAWRQNDRNPRYSKMFKRNKFFISTRGHFCCALVYKNWGLVSAHRHFFCNITVEIGSYRENALGSRNVRRQLSVFHCQKALACWMGSQKFANTMGKRGQNAMKTSMNWSSYRIRHLSEAVPCWTSGSAVLQLARPQRVEKENKKK